jgi:hypothetical protein
LISVANAQVRWAGGRNGSIPAGAFPAGNQGGGLLFLCRANTNNNLIAGKFFILLFYLDKFKLLRLFTGKLDTVQGICVVGFNGGVSRLSTYDVATGNPIWRNTNRQTAIPGNAVLVGFTSNREETYACRAMHDGHQLPGRVDAQRRCFVPLSGREFQHDNYQILLQ